MKELLVLVLFASLAALSVASNQTEGDKGDKPRPCDDDEDDSDYKFERLSSHDFVNLADNISEALELGVDAKFESLALRNLKSADEWAKKEGDQSRLQLRSADGEDMNSAFKAAYSIQTGTGKTSLKLFEDMSRVSFTDSGQAESLSIDKYYTWPCLVLPYQCPWTKRVLWALPYLPYRLSPYPCYVPYPRLQKIMYATCDCKYCRAPFRRGVCRPSCYEPRTFWVACRIHGAYRWHRVTRWLPQRCSCRTLTPIPYYQSVSKGPA